jgi:glutamate synthase (NADPH/NADH) large chain
MMRKCHLNTCPVGIATQDPVLRKRFTGQPEHVINYFFYVAEEVREIMAQLGYRTMGEMVGQMQMLDRSKVIEHWKAKGLDFSRLFKKPDAPEGVAIRNTEKQNHHLEKVLDRTLVAEAYPALERGEKVVIETLIRNVNRSTGAMLSGEVAKKYGHKGLPDDTITVKMWGTAGQAYGAWLAQGVSFELEGEANDYVGKGLAGGRITVKPPKNSGVVPENSIIVGNTVLYGAIAGEVYFRGVAGERFAVRNSGAIAVVEGTGDHGCEYMTGGVVVVLGQTGRNFAAGMSGGVAYVLDMDGSFKSRCNMSMVELEPVAEEEELMRRVHNQGGDLHFKGRVELTSDMTRLDAERLMQLIAHHEHYTGSTRAKDILDNWAEYRGKFVKVMPVEYRRALAEMHAKRDLVAAE